MKKKNIFIIFFLYNICMILLMKLIYFFHENKTKTLILKYIYILFIYLKIFHIFYFYVHMYILYYINNIYIYNIYNFFSKYMYRCMC